MPRLGIWVFPDIGLSDISSVAARVESLGYNHLWLGDEGFARDVYVALAGCSNATSRLGLGVAITNPYLRHPLVSAIAAASVDELSGGRAIYGLGAGGSLTLRPVGVSSAKPVQAVSEAITIARQVFSGRRVEFRGELFSAVGGPYPYSRPSLPIMVAGRGPKMLEMAARRADMIFLSGIAKPHLRQVVDKIRSVAADADRRVEIVYATYAAYSEATRVAIKRNVAYFALDCPPDVKTLIGLNDQLEAEMRARLQAGGLEAASELVTEDMLKTFVLAGSLDECKAEARSIVSNLGFDEFVIEVPHGIEATVVAEDFADLFLG